MSLPGFSTPFSVAILGHERRERMQEVRSEEYVFEISILITTREHLYDTFENKSRLFFILRYLPRNITIPGFHYRAHQTRTRK